MQALNGKPENVADEELLSLLPAAYPHIAEPESALEYNSKTPRSRDVIESKSYKIPCPASSAGKFSAGGRLLLFGGAKISRVRIAADQVEPSLPQGMGAASHDLSSKYPRTFADMLLIRREENEEDILDSDSSSLESEPVLDRLDTLRQHRGFSVDSVTNEELTAPGGRRGSSVLMNMLNLESGASPFTAFQRIQSVSEFNISDEEEDEDEALLFSNNTSGRASPFVYLSSSRVKPGPEDERSISSRSKRRMSAATESSDKVPSVANVLRRFKRSMIEKRNYFKIGTVPLKPYLPLLYTSKSNTFNAEHGQGKSSVLFNSSIMFSSEPSKIELYQIESTTFLELAINYRVKTYDIVLPIEMGDRDPNEEIPSEYLLKAALCRHNSQVAADYQYISVSQVWSLLAISYEALFATRSEMCLAPWKESNLGILLILSLISHLRDANDLQTLACLLAISGPLVLKYNGLTQHEMNRIFFAYANTLQSWGANIEACLMLSFVPEKDYKSAFKDIGIAFSLGRVCNKASDPIRCKHYEKKLLLCSVCQSNVHSLFIHCPDCGHGGHLEHIKLWFSQNGDCPTGCGCICGTRFAFDEDDN